MPAAEKEASGADPHRISPRMRRAAVGGGFTSAL
jgi:hypothetical protein